MRLRTWLTLTTGAAAGAGAMYLLDPEHGVERRRHARQHALRQAQQQAVRLAAEGRRQAGELAGAARAGFEQGRRGAGEAVANDEPPR